MSAGLDIEAERAAFEAYARSKHWRLEKAIQYVDQPHAERPYNSVRTAGAWEGWLARAGCAQAPVPAVTIPEQFPALNKQDRIDRRVAAGDHDPERRRGGFDRRALVSGPKS